MPTARKTVVKRAKPVAKAPTSKNGRYHYQIEMNGNKFSGRTNTIARTLQSHKPDHHSTKMVTRFSLKPMTKKSTAKVVEHVYMIPMARRLMSNTMAADLHEKRVKMGLGDYNG